MAYIVIAYKLYDIEGQSKRIYDDSTEKYFDSMDNKDAKNYSEYLIQKGMNIDISEIKILQEGDFDVSTLFRADALAKLTDKEKETLGLS